MAEVAGALIISALTSAGVTGVMGFSLASTTIFGVGLASVLGGAVLLGAAIGLQSAFGAKPNLPQAESGSQPLMQAVPPRIRGYGRCRISGYYMLFEATNNTSYDVIAFHSGRVAAVVGLYLHDDQVFHNADYPTDDVVSTIIDDGRYATAVHIRYHDGSPLTTDPFFFNGSDMDGLFDPTTHQGNGIAWVSLLCGPSDTPDVFTKVYPRNLPVPSVVADLSPVWDPRDLTQSRSSEATWQISYNPVIQLIDFLTRVDGGLGLDYDIMLAPVIDQWMEEADICDASVLKADGSYEPRYQSHGWFQFDNKPEDIINAILSTCDGWMCEAGDGTLALKVGLYREPTVTLTEAHILGFSVNYGQADEQAVNQIEITFTDGSQKYVKVQAETLRDEEAISNDGAVRSQPLDLTWVQSYSQARRLAARAMERLNPTMTGSFVTTLYGLRAMGERWVNLQYPYVSGLQDSVVEIQDAEIDLMAGRITFNFRRVAPDQIEAYDPDTDEGTPPVVPPPSGYSPLLRENGALMLREDGSVFVRET